MKIDQNGFIGKQINEMQMYGRMCIINFTDGSCLEIEANTYDYGSRVEMEYNFTPSETNPSID